MNNDLPKGWIQHPDFRGEKCVFNEERLMLISSSTTKSTLVRENEIYLEFNSENHLNDAIERSNEIWEDSYAPVDAHM